MQELSYHMLCNQEDTVTGLVKITSILCYSSLLVVYFTRAHRSASILHSVHYGLLLALNSAFFIPVWVENSLRHNSITNSLSPLKSKWEPQSAWTPVYTHGDSDENTLGLHIVKTPQYTRALLNSECHQSFVITGPAGEIARIWTLVQQIPSFNFTTSETPYLFSAICLHCIVVFAYIT